MTMYFLKRGTDNTIVCSSCNPSASAMLLNQGYVMIGKKDACTIIMKDASCIYSHAYLDEQKRLNFERILDNETNL